MEKNNEDIPTRFHIGTQKAGSTFLYNLLSSHPEVALSSKTEVHYYDKFYNKELSWYLSLFPNEGIKIDTSPKYFMNGEIVAPRIAESCGPKAKFLLILRNPIDLLNSHYQMHVITGRFKKYKDLYPIEPSSVVDCVRLYPDYINRAKYYKELTENWLRYFDKSQFKIVIFEDFIKNTDKVIVEILKFWDLPVCELKVNSTSKNRMLKNNFLYKLSVVVVKRPKLKEWLKRQKIVNYVYENYLTASSKSLMSNEERRELRDILADEVNQLSNLCGRQITEWKDFNALR